MRQTRNDNFLRISTLGDTVYWARRLRYLWQQAWEDQEAVQRLIGRINRLRPEQGQGNPSLGTNLLVIPRGSEGRGGLSSANMQAAIGTNHPPGPSGSSSRSPARDANNGSGRHGRSYNGRSKDTHGSLVPQHLCCRASSKDSVIIERFRGKRGDDVDGS